MGRPKGNFGKKEPLTEMQKLAKKIGPDGEDVVQELEGSDVETLNKRIAQANQSISDTKEELEENEEYVKAKENKKLLSSGFSEVKKRQNAIIAVCVQFRKAKGAA
jgi:predicted translin family RNA/ssDNA-binding protein